MNRVEELIQQLCPNGVEWKKLGEVCELCRGTVITQKEAIKGNVPVISGGQTPAYFHNKANRPGNTIVVAGSGAYAGFVSFWEIPIFVSDAFTIKPHNELNVKFVFYFLKTIQHKIYATKKGAGIPHVHGSSIQNFEIPIPPLPIQQEIVRILDTFTELSTNLQTELEARKKQYAYYRDCLLNFEGLKGVEWKKLGEIFEIRNGYTPSKANKEYWENGTIPWFRMEDIRENGHILAESIQYVNIKGIKSGKLFPANSIILATTATIGEHALILKDYLANQRFSCLVRKPEFIPLLDIKFVFYYMFTIDEWCKNNTNISGFASVDMDKLRKKMFPIPLLSEQRRIVSILDQFETLVNDLSIGLPAELEARRKQYEYYRDKLLTFDRV